MKYSIWGRPLAKLSPLVQTDYSDKIMVNSEFTQKHFMSSFYRLRRAPRVVYPGIDLSAYEPATVEQNLSKFQSERGTLSTAQEAVRDCLLAT